VLTLSVAATLATAGYFASARHGVSGLTALGVAAGVCWVAATAALLVTVWLRAHVVSGMLLAMPLRMGLPLLVGVALDSRGGPLADAGVFGWIVVFYLVVLAVETPLAVACASTTRQPQPGSRPRAPLCSGGITDSNRPQDLLTHG
jgi:hypothetical protein